MPLAIIMSGFFTSDNAPDALYNSSRDDDFSWHGETAREFIERAWAKCGEYCDPDLPLQAKQHFLARFWELYLAYSLDSWGLVLALQRKVEGPDLRLIHPPAWIEAVVVRAGAGSDAVKKPPEGVAYSVPDKDIQLRLRSALEEKARKLRKYQQEGVVDRRDALVIAVNPADVPNARSEMPLPRIVRVLFPFGAPVAHWDAQSLEVTRTSHAYEAEITKRSGSAVSTAIFLSPDYSHISGVIYSSSDPINRPAEPGADFVLVHNPLADSPLPKQTFPVGQEYWKEGGELKLVENARP